MASVTLVCSSCGDAEIELYYCETCSSEVVEGSNSNEQELLCEACLTHHIKRGHQVRNSKGQEPLVCSQHRRLHGEYCRTCDVTICPKCLGEHSEHKMGSIDERAIEIKKEVFEMLTTLEMDEKPLRAKKESLIELQKSHESEQKELREVVENQIEELRQKALKRLDDNLQLLENEKEKNTQIIESVLKLQQESRDLLSATSPHLIKDFKKAKENYESAKEACSKALVTDYYAKSTELAEITNMVDDFGNEFVKKLESVLRKRKSWKAKKLESEKVGKRFGSKISGSVERFVITASPMNTFLFTVSEGLINVGKLTVSGVPEKVDIHRVGHVEFGGYIQSYYEVHDESTLCSVVLLGYHGCAYRMDVRKDSSCDLSEISPPSYEHILCPYTMSNSSQMIHWCYWDENHNLLKFSHNVSFIINCESLPTWKRKMRSGCDLCFVLQENKLLVVDPNRHSSELIAISGIGQKLVEFDHVTFLNRNCCVIWCAKSKSIILIKIQSVVGSVREVQRWNEPTDVIRFKNVGTIRFIPALTGSNSSNDFKYVFAII
ncbi:uncharacterized protein LOC142352262 [Convolutriloba macropyga]|uniref:uncharacterized protein LOC142352262 n=1 Tax=Convolutriloba macropyga TaxID=536237 RepID=UPI003F525792